MPIDKNNLIEKRNVLNEIRKNSMSLQELRFFSIYLSKINARDVSTRQVFFPLEDFQRIMEFGRLNIQQLQDTTNSLLGKVVNVKLESGGYTGFQLFKKCRVDKDEYGKWYIMIDAHDDALPLMFDFKKDYFTYELWNTLRLKSPNQIRMYEILKQYEKLGQRKLRLTDLKQLLGLAPSEYPRWSNFKVRVLDSCQEALQQTTDIRFTYVPLKDGKKTCGVHFFIEANDLYEDQLTLEEFIDLQGTKEDALTDAGWIEDDKFDEPESIFDHTDVDIIADALPASFSAEEVESLRLEAVKRLGYDPTSPDSPEVRIANYLQRYTANMEASNKRKPIRDKYKWLLAAISNGWYD